MPTAPEARQFAHDWIDAWNARDIDRILAHYAPSVTLTSPAAAQLLNDPSGTVTGLPALRDYFQRGLEAFPNFHFELIEVLPGSPASSSSSKTSAAPTPPSSWNSTPTAKSSASSPTTPPDVAFARSPLLFAPWRPQAAGFPS